MGEVGEQSPLATTSTVAAAKADGESIVPSEKYPVDDILKGLSTEQQAKLKSLWIKLDRLTTDGSTKTDAVTQTTGSAVPETEAEIKYSKAFKKAMADLTPEQLHSALWSMVKQDDPDTLLVRFLRARKWDVERALIMLIAAMHWRLTMKVEDYILPAGDVEFVRLAASTNESEKKLGEQVLAQLRCGKSFARGTDRKGRPLVYIRVRLHRASMQSLEALERFIIFNAETARMLLRSPNTTAAVVFDMTGFGMANMDWNALRLLASGLADNYPESLGGVYILCAPWIVNGIWSVVRGWLDPEIASKVHFVKDTSKLAEFIDPAIIPRSMDGESDWEPEYVEPSPKKDLTPDEEARKTWLEEERRAIVEEYEQVTKEWAHGEGDAAESMARRRDLFAKLRTNYWTGDRFWRGESLLDRMGVIGSDGSYNPLAWKTDAVEP